MPTLDNGSELVFTDVRQVSEACARTAVSRTYHATEVCDEFAEHRRVVYAWKCECECHERITA